MPGLSNIEFRKAAIPDEIGTLCDFDRKIFGSYPDDLFSPDEWAENLASKCVRQRPDIIPTQMSLPL